MTSEPKPTPRYKVGDTVVIRKPEYDEQLCWPLGMNLFDGRTGIVSEVDNTNPQRIFYCLNITDRYRFLEAFLEPVNPKPKTDKEYGPSINGFQIRFTQEPNSLGTTDSDGVGVEDLTVDCEYQLPGEEPFFVIRTTSGWSFDQPETLLALLTTVKESEKLCRSSMPQT
jgi:hypothetical protein